MHWKIWHVDQKAFKQVSWYNLVRWVETPLKPPGINRDNIRITLLTFSGTLSNKSDIVSILTFFFGFRPLFDDVHFICNQRRQQPLNLVVNKALTNSTIGAHLTSLDERIFQQIFWFLYYISSAHYFWSLKHLSDSSFRIKAFFFLNFLRRSQNSDIWGIWFWVICAPNRKTHWIFDKIELTRSTD